VRCALLLILIEREKGSETGFHKGRRITRDANILAGFANPDPDGTRHAGTRSKSATGNCWAMCVMKLRARAKIIERHCVS
jgi:hypothetical protein